MSKADCARNPAGSTVDFRRIFIILAVSNFFLSFGFNVWSVVFNNFAVEDLGIRASQLGLLQSIREIPGLLGFVIGFLVLWLSEMRVLAVSVLALGLGLVMTGWATGFGSFTVATLVMSIGFHFYYPVNSSVVLMAAGKEEAPKVLGRLGSISSLAAVLGTVVIWVLVDGLEVGPLSIAAWGYRRLFFLTGALVLAGGLVSLRSGQIRGLEGERRKVVFRRDYWIYYLLTFLMGSRRHIFSTFAVFLLVQVYGIDVRTTATLFLINNLFSTYASAQLGKLVARFGERRMLTANFAAVTCVFLGYAYIPSLPLLFVLFVVDHILFGFTVAVDSYFQKIAYSPDEITSNVSLAQTINHVSALVVPVLGGILWEQIAPAATFVGGAVITLLSLVVVQFIRARAEPAQMPVALG